MTNVNRCPWCGSKAKVIKTDPLGYYCRCAANSDHNIGRLIYGNAAFSDSENAAICLWDEETNKMK